MKKQTLFLVISALLLVPCFNATAGSPDKSPGLSRRPSMIWVEPPEKGGSDLSQHGLFAPQRLIESGVVAALAQASKQVDPDSFDVSPETKKLIAVVKTSVESGAERQALVNGAIRVINHASPNKLKTPDPALCTVSYAIVEVGGLAVESYGPAIVKALNESAFAKKMRLDKVANGTVTVAKKVSDIPYVKFACKMAATYGVTLLLQTVVPELTPGILAALQQKQTSDNAGSSSS